MESIFVIVLAGWKDIAKIQDWIFILLFFSSEFLHPFSQIDTALGLIEQKRIHDLKTQKLGIV